MAVTFRDKDGTTRLAGDLLIGGTTGDVATVQADGTIGPAPGGSQPSVKWVDLGVVTAAALGVSGARTLYTTAEGEFISAVRFGDSFTAVDTNNLQISLHLAEWLGEDPYGFVNTSDVADAAALGIKGGALFNDGAHNVVKVSPPLLEGALVATLAFPGDLSFLGTTPGWQANHTYPDTAAVIAAGHFWDFGGSGPGSGGLSGGSAPDFAGNIGGSVTDGPLTWYDERATPAAGSFHVYIEVVTPATP